MVLLDRRSVYHALVRNNIPVVRHVVCSRDGHNGAGEPVVEEYPNYIIVNGVRMDKPFVEKPVNSEDHNIRIYYPDQAGSRHLFRKVENKSSEYHPDVNTIRREGSYIYEEFVETDSAADVKVYTVGIDYAHAESRKSPVVDGEVQRDENGKEIRFNTPLSEYERQIARKIVKVFRQRVCGFDVLRIAGGKSYVCDVNGWSFVKGNTEYYNAASAIICEIFVEEMRKRGLSRITADRPGKRELRGVIALFRHGDRTPKQKIKLKTSHQPTINLAFGKTTGIQSEIVIKGTDTGSTLQQWRDLFTLLASSDEISSDDRSKYQGMLDVMEREAEGLKLQIKPQKYHPETKEIIQCQVILKWGGWLTDAGRMQARNLGGKFNHRVLRGGEMAHKIEVFSNNERRVRNTAVEFAATCASNWDESQMNPGPRGKEICKSLDDTEKAKVLIEQSKKNVENIMHLDTPEECDEWRHLPGFDLICQLKVTPKRAMRHCFNLINELIGHIPEGKSLHRNESCTLVRSRWTKLAEGFYNEKTGKYDTTKVSDIFDYISYDVSYNQEALFPLDLYPLFELAQALNNFVGIGEYGTTPDLKSMIGAQIITPLLTQWRQDLNDLQQIQEPKTRLYFSSESHIQALYNVLYHSGQTTPFHVVADPIQLHYLSHIVMKVYKYNDMDPGAIGRYQMEVLFSSGIDTNAFGIVKDHHVSSLTPMIRIHNNLYYHEFESLVTDCIDKVKEQAEKNQSI
eukprot:TRINITY_DN1567_c3_g1_i1.p1 TRINITY_DN1567_c3_g1~~TRINITY_DN1567_c3_g1_i1.p1  ORF type:complete len:870 (+),score=183.05 TRINITY_DN1567_c3_g1_i1:393-2612(+)